MVTETAQTETAVQPAPTETAVQPAETLQEQQPAKQTETAESLKAELARVEKALKDANRKAAADRNRLAELEKTETERQKAQMTEEEKRTARLSELEKLAAEAQRDKERALADAASLRIRASIVAAAAMKGFMDPEDAFHLADLSNVTLKDDGKVDGIEEALTALAKAKPYMLRQPGKPIPQIQPMNPAGATEPSETPEQRRARLSGGRSSFLDPNAARLTGGGVMMSPDNPKQQPRGAGG